MEKKYYGLARFSEVSGRHVREHIWTWENFMQVEVPFSDRGKRCHIHHLDGNSRNNDILNLVCIEPEEHMRIEHMHTVVSAQTRKKMSEAKKGNKNALKASKH